MFRDYIQNPIDPIPVEYLQTLNSLENEPDYALSCLGVAMLRSRIENYKGIGGAYKSASTEEGAVNDFIARAPQDYPTLYYYRYSRQAEKPEELKEMLVEHGFEIKDTIGAFLKDKADVRCVAAYHKTNNMAAIFINSGDIRFYHMIISFLPLLFPAVFTEHPLEAKDYDMIKSLSKTDKSIFIQKVQAAVQDYMLDFRKMMLTSLLKTMHEVKINQAFNNVTNARERVTELQNRFSDMVKELKRLIVIYEGMKATEEFDEPEEDLVDYLSTNKQIRNLRINGERLYFSVATLLNNYNADAWETFARRGYIYQGGYGRGGANITLLEAFTKPENRKLLLNNIFNESPEFSVKICGNYSIDLNSCYLSADRNYNYEDADPMFKSYVPNPHIKLYACLGGYEPRVSKALTDRNYIAAIEMCCASAGSVNLEETEQTFRPFLGWIMSSREKILRHKDGTDMTPEEALIYLKDKENKE